jgi:hypothetical protein
VDDNTYINLAELICGDLPGAPVYRSGDRLTKFFAGADVGRFVHDGSTRRFWVAECLRNCSKQELAKILKRFVSPYEYGGDKQKVKKALTSLNAVVYVEGFKVVLNGTSPVFEMIEVNFNLDQELGNEAFLEIPNLDFLKFDGSLHKILEGRLEEIKKCVEMQTHLASTILMGSFLEGLLLGVFQRYPEDVARCQSSPKDSKTGKVKPFSGWTLSEMIDVAHKLGWIRTSMSKFSHALRDFRNLIHPNVQITSNTYPDLDSVKISWIIIQASIRDLSIVFNKRDSI